MAETRTSTRRFLRHLVAAAAVLVAAMWLSTGTMAPYAATAQYPAVIEPCHYLVNIDHEHFFAAYRMLRGEEPALWRWSVVLRRLLFPVIALPFVNVFGFLAGGFIATVLLHVAALIGFSRFVEQRIGEAAALSAMWLLATYPGVTYWAGLPYSYVAIVPGSLACMMLLYGLDGAANRKGVFTASLLLGIVFLAYDFLPLFGTAAAFVLVARRRWAWTLVACAAMAIPTALLALLFIAAGVPLVNGNTATYLVIVNAYLHPHDMAQWAAYLRALPAVVVANFLFSNMVMLPLLFCVAGVTAMRRRIDAFARPEIALLAVCAAVCVFNNAAPPYDGWQLRGQWIARLYQPLFPAFLMIVGRVSQRLTAEKWWHAAVALTVVANASIAFGPVMMNPVAAVIYQRFYVHSPPESLLLNLRRFGRRPLGFCRPTHEGDGVRNPNTEGNRPPFMYRYPRGAR